MRWGITILIQNTVFHKTESVTLSNAFLVDCEWFQQNKRKNVSSFKKSSVIWKHFKQGNAGSIVPMTSVTKRLRGVREGTCARPWKQLHWFRRQACQGDTRNQKSQGKLRNHPRPFTWSGMHNRLHLFFCAFLNSSPLLFVFFRKWLRIFNGNYLNNSVRIWKYSRARVAGRGAQGDCTYSASKHPWLLFLTEEA